MSKLNTVNLDAGNNLLTIGGGTIFSDVIPTLYSAGKEMREPCIVYCHLTIED